MVTKAWREKIHVSPTTASCAGRHSRRVLIGIITCWAACSCVPADPDENDNEAVTDPNAIRGVVYDSIGPVPGAVVRIQTTAVSTETDGDGRFMLRVGELGCAFDGASCLLTAWAPGYYIVGPLGAQPGDSGVTITLVAHDDQDHADYEWLPSVLHPGTGLSQGCAECHSSAGTELDFALPADEWQLDAHAQAAINPRFLTMYGGTDVEGNASPQTSHVDHPDYGRIPLPPNPSLPYYGPGFKLDFPDQTGNCATCHTPLAAIDTPYQIDPREVDGIAAEGIACDFCHKVWDVRLDALTGLPAPNITGVLAIEFRRPPDSHQFFAGPLDDVAPGEDTYSPVQQTSQYCAPCHSAVFWNVTVYNSFGEWLDSPYSDPVTGQTCQDCHMPHLGATHFALPDQGGLARDPETIFSHRMPGAADKELLRNAVTMNVTGKREQDTVIVTVDITNDRTGHHVPTDSPLRHLILLVDASGHDGARLPQLDGPTLPAWCGEGDPERGYYAGLPGTAFAKVLEEFWTEVSPTGAYWNPTRVLSDNRIAARATHRSTYTFEAADDAEVNVHVRLLFRRAFVKLMDQKGWLVPDIVMEEARLMVTP